MNDTEMIDWLQEFGYEIFQNVNEKYVLEYLDANGFPHQSDSCDTLRECILSVAKETK